MHRTAKYFIIFAQKCFYLARGSRQCQTKSNIAVQNLQSFTVSALFC